MARSRRVEHLWLAAYPLAWIGLFALSNHYWFLPAGLRLGTLLLLPRRLWWKMALVEWTAILALGWVRDFHPNVPSLIVSSILPWGIYAALVSVFRHPFHGEPTSQAMARLWICGIAAATANALLQTAAVPPSPLTSEIVIEHAFAYALGDFIGVVAVMPLMLIARERLADWRHGWLPLLGRGGVFAPMATVVVLGLLPLPVATRYPLILSSFVLYYVAFRHGWRVAAVAVTLLSSAVYAVDTSMLMNWRPTQLQLLIAASGCAALLLGAASDALRTQGKALVSTIEMLSQRTQALRDAANRLTSKEEEERRRLGIELHDQLGQDMTAIATQLRLVERNAGDSLLRADLQAIGRLTASAHEHLRHVIEHLHPLVLDRFGLARALSAGPLAEMARREGIDYLCSVDADVARLPHPVAVAVYRICQEATTNAVKHGCGGRIHITIQVEPRRSGATLSLRISDDAGPLAIPADSVGYGLQAIQDRARALGALYRFAPEQGDPRHWMYLELTAQELVDPEPR